MRPLFKVPLLKSDLKYQKAYVLLIKIWEIVNIWSWFQVIILIMLQMTAFSKKREQKLGFQRWQIRPFLEKRQKPPDFDKVL